ncbi:rhodanese-like domain-containing protein [Catonella massiliensis]|uniref:Rhodanese-like domain-containing protein n=1 Tax=Catonella massiliensis TaxID=2799636 RepID=A0ABS1IXR3_9FIRM|nr:rhodanese-like domain-containing protein [Catonella massiliensis]MBK5896681.1 rhodanese-like domain-containing protein [Catonella massiliensis]
MEKTKIIALVAALSLTLGTTGAITGCGSKSDSTIKTSTASTASAVAYQYIPAADVLKVTDSHILDVREEENYKKGAVEGSEWQPIFPLDDTSLESAMKEYATSKLNDGKNIYIVCNSGKRGAEKTTGILIEAGIDKSKIFTVEGGAKALAEIDGALKPVQ